MVPIPSRHGEEIRRHVCAFWKRAYGTPKKIVVGGEKGFSVGEFTKKAQADGSEVNVTSATSPWQAGKTERAGGTWKECYYRMQRSFAVRRLG